MEVASSGPQTLSEPHRRGTPLPLSQLVEESRSEASIPNYLLESKIFATLKSNNQIQADPSELHFSSFELGKRYTKTLKLINISSEAINIHIISTQTKYFQTTYTKKFRLLPGLTYTLNVSFCPEEWRYFYDCIRVHCKGEENLLIPVHAYPAIDDLHIPPHIGLSAVPLGQSVHHVIPLRCSCPVDFEFQVYVIQPNEAFCIHPLAGVIPANGEGKITVTFCPFQYETSQFTFQLVVSQFNTKPYLCTVSGSSSPYLALRKPDDRVAESGGRPRPALHSGRQSRQSSIKEADKLKTVKDQMDVKQGQLPSMDVCTPGGVAKMLIKDISKLSSKDLKQALSCGSMKGKKSRQMKEALFMKKVQQAAEEEQAHYLRWQVHTGMEPMSEQRQRRILEERETALYEYRVKKGDERQDEDFAREQTKLSSLRMLRDARQDPDKAPVFQLYTSIRWELRQRAFTLFQQAARKVVIRCRMQRRVASLKKLADSIKKAPSVDVKDKKCVLEVSLNNVSPSSFYISPREDNPTALGNLVALPVDPIDVSVTAHIPFLKLQVPQHYKLMGYQPVSAWEAFRSHIPTALARPLRAGAPEVQGPVEEGVNILEGMELKVGPNEEEPVATEEAAGLSFRAPKALIRPFCANPLRIFNPAPGVQSYKPQPKYLESDLDFFLCPLPKFALCESSASGLMTQSPHAEVFHQQEAISGMMKERDFNPVSIPITTKSAPRRLVDYNTDILPLSAPLPLPALPDDRQPLTESPCEGPGVQLTPEMIRAEFLLGKAPVSNSNPTTGTRARLEVTHRSDINQMQTRLMARLKQLEGEERENEKPLHTHTHPLQE
ncbi:cilia- and flagella-associated protein 221 isoform 1-T2 [Anableps anableps]